MTKTFFLDTSILGDDANAIYEFADKPGNKVIITDVNIEETDRNKKKQGSFGMNCRQLSMNLFSLIENKGKLSDGVQLESGGLVKLLTKYKRKPEEQLKCYIDLGPKDLSQMCAVLDYSNKNKDEEVRFVTMDRNLALVARENGIKAEWKKGKLLDPKNLYSGYRVVDDMDLYGEIIGSAQSYEEINYILNNEIEGLATNEYVVFADNQKERIDRKAIFRYDKPDKLLKPIKYNYGNIMGFEPKNLEQTLAFDLLLDDTIKIKSLVGEAGTGKTFLALLAAIHKVITKREDLKGKDYEIPPVLRITKRMAPVQSEEYGFLPGDIVDKVISNYAGISANYQRIANGNRFADEFFEAHALPKQLSQVFEQVDLPIKLMPLADVRGESLGPYDILLIDEAQNMEPAAMRTLLTRPGECGEVFITGDITQQDNRSLFDYDGLTHTVNAIVNTTDPEYMPLLGSLTLRVNERSKLSDWATKYL